MAFTSVQEILAGMTSLDPAKTQGVNSVMLFDLSGEGGGKWTLTLKDDEGVKLEAGETASPNVTFTMDAQDFLAIANGELNPVSAFMQGKVKVSGDMALAMRLQTLLS
jgi:putative sterol carrier protein